MTSVLIVDDQPVFRRQLRQLLSKAGLSVIGEAGDIPTAKKLVQEHQPDIAVVDIMLPEISGIEGTPQLKALATNLKVILVSAYQDSSQVFQQSAEEVGAEAFFSKDDLSLVIVKSWIQNQT